jgi:hypothetical protein
MILSLPLTRKVLPLLRSLRFGDRWLFAIASILVLTTYVGLNTTATVPVADSAPQSYYQMLTEAFLSGRTYLSLEPDPRLRALADPWAGAQGIPRAHDATYYNGKYYLYFGSGPVLMLMAPWHIATGTYLRDGTATCIFASAGFLLSGLFYLRLKRRFFPELSPWWTFAAVLAVGWGSFVPFIVASPRIYDVPIACGFACFMLAAHALLSAAAATRSTTLKGAILIASVAWGLAITARPNYIFGIAPLGVCAGLIFYRSRTSASPSSAVGFWTAALGPVAVACAGIALYNYARFDDPKEFGTTFQFSAMDMRRTKLFAVANVGQSLGQYVLKEARRSAYYPFVDSSTDVFGIVHWVPFSIVAFGLPFTWMVRRTRNPVWLIPLGFLLAAALCNFGSLLPLPFANARYEVDFLPSLTLVGMMVVSIAFVALADSSRWARWLAGLALAGLLAPSIFDSLASGLPPPGAGHGVRAVARVLNLPAEGIERLNGIKYGPAEFDIEFPGGAKGRREPLLATGDGGDCVFVEYLGAGRGRIGYVHMGAPGRLSEPILLGSAVHRMRIDMGSLYPEPEQAVFRGWSDDDIAALRRRLVVELDGNVILRASSGFYRSNAWKTSIASIPIAGQIAPAFTGNISNFNRLGLPSAAEVRTGYETGPVRIVARFPEFKAIVGQPLVSTGVAGAGDMLYVLYLGPGKARFGHDCWNYGLYESEPVLFDPNEDQVIEADMDSLRAPPNGGLHTLRIRFNGREIASVERRFNPSTPEEVAFGYNQIGASTAENLFTGPKLKPRRLAMMPSGPLSFGAVHIVAKLPQDLNRAAEPLVVTGRQGAADIVYLSFPDPGHVQVGCDHWGVGGPLSSLIAVHGGETIDVEISMGSLHYEEDPEWLSVSPEERKRLKSSVVVHFNGPKVLDAPITAYSCTPEEVFVGVNPVGGSSCAAKFNGTIISSARIGAVYQR